MDTTVLWAGAIGALCASSLVIGAVIGVKVRIPQATVGLLAAFGGGALLCALAIELVAPTVLAFAAAPNEIVKLEEAEHLLTLISGCIAGGILFVLLDQLVNAKGGYLRKKAYVISKTAIERQAFNRKALAEVMNVPIFFNLPAEKMAAVLSHMRPRFFLAGETIFSRCDSSHGLYLIRKGFVLIDHPDRSEPIELGHGEVVGEISLLADAPCSADCEAKTDVEMLLLTPADFTSLRKQIPELEQQLRELAVHRIEENRGAAARNQREQERWATLAIEAISHGGHLPTQDDLRRRHQSHGNAALAIWLGTLLDAVPESLIIGISLTTAASSVVAAGGDLTFWSVFPYTLIAGLFLSDLPEALSASQQMKMQGLSTTKVLFLWGSLVVFTALGAAAGAAMAGHIDHNMQVFIEGIGAGAMLVMICAAMIPEAAHLADANLVGTSTLTGFLCPILFKFME